MNTQKYLQQINDSIQNIVINGVSDSNISTLDEQPIDLGVGDIDVGTQRITIADDDTNLAAINSNVLELKDSFADTLRPAQRIVGGGFSAINQQVLSFLPINVTDGPSQGIRMLQQTIGTGGVGAASNESNIATDPRNTYYATPRICIADDDTNLAAMNTNLAAVYDCVDIANNRLDVDTTAINGVTMSVDDGNNDTGTQRITIARDDFISNAINDNILNLVQCVDPIFTSDLRCRVMNIPEVTVNSGDIEISGSVNATIVGTPAVTVSSGTIEISNASFPVTGTINVGNFPGTQAVSGTVAVSGLSGTSAVNFSQFGGNAIAAGSGINGTGVQRVSMATDDTLFLNQTKCIIDYRFLATNFIPVQVGGYATLSGNSVYYCVPNNASYTYTESNTGPPIFGGTITCTGSGSKDYTGVDGAQYIRYVNYLYNSATANTAIGTQLNSNAEALVDSLYEVTRWYVSELSNATSNINNLVLSNSVGPTYISFVPAGWSEGVKWYAQVPGSNGRVYLKNLTIVSCDTVEDGCWVKIVNKIWNKTTGVQLFQSILFEQYFKGMQGDRTVDLSYIQQIGMATNLNWQIGASSVVCQAICLYVKGSSVTTQNVGVYLNCNVYRA